MGAIELVIKIPKKVYNYIQSTGNINMLDTQQVANAIFDGTPLPKGHGRVIDESQINNCGWNFVNHHAKTDATTIIEADAGSEE